MLMKELPNCTQLKRREISALMCVYINNLAEWALSTRRRALVEWLSRVLVTSSRFENISVEEPIARHLNKTNLLIELKGEEKEIYGACNAEIVS